MLRFGIILSTTLLGVAIGAVAGLIGAAAFVEFGKQSCNGAECGAIIVRGILPGAIAIGAMLGFSKGVNIVSPQRVLRSR
ncbi:MAG: hypothetical protein AB7F96_19900 [Beijerinckiaceae bacterium]